MSIADNQVARFEKSLSEVVRRLQALIIKNAKSGYLFSADADERIRFAPDLLQGLSLIHI